MTPSTKTNTQIKICIADDHPLFRRGLKHALEDAPDISVLAEADNGDGLLHALEEQPIDVLVLDISMPGRSALEILKQLKSDRPKLPVLILSVHPEDPYASRFLRAVQMDRAEQAPSPKLAKRCF